MPADYVLARHDRATWARQVVAEHPPIPEVADVIGRFVTGRLHKASDPILWWPYDVVWSSVDYLHKHGRHGEACELAVLLLWIDDQGSDFMWELSTSDNQHQAAARIPAGLVDVELPKEK